MKIESEKVRELLLSIKYFTEGINETLNLGDDGLEDAIRVFTKEIDGTITTFEVMNLQELNNVDEDKRYDYLKHYEQFSNEHISLADEKKMYKAHLYLYVKKFIRDEIKASDLAAIENDYIVGYLSNNIVENSKFQKQANSDLYFWSTQNVLQDIANELIEERKKAPQQTLF